MYNILKTTIALSLLFFSTNILFPEIKQINNKVNNQVNKKVNKTERTLAIIKPDAVQNKLSGEIIKIIELNCFEIIDIKKVKLTEKEAQDFYKEHKKKPFYKDLVKYMTSGPVIAMALEKENAIADWRSLMGSTDPNKAAFGTIRKMFGKSIQSNATHGSDSLESAKRELKFFFC